MKITVDVWEIIENEHGHNYGRMFHETFSENELIEMITEKLKEKYSFETEVEINEIISR